MLFSQKGVKTENEPVKNGVKGRQGTVLLPQERVRLKLTQSKIALTVRWVQCCFPRRRKTENHPVKNSVIGTQGTTLFPRRRVRL